LINLLLVISVLSFFFKYQLIKKRGKTHCLIFTDLQQEEAISGERSMPFIVVTQLLLMKNALKEGNQKVWQEQEIDVYL